MSIKILNGSRSIFYDLDTAYSNGNIVGRISWDQDNATAQIGLNTNVVLHMGQDDMWYVKNQTGASIPKGSVVYAAGTLGASGRILVAPYIANGTIAGRFILGITAEAIADGADGYVIAKGKLRNFNTNSFTAGTVLWASPTTAGAMTSTEPSAPNIKAEIAFVVHQSANGVLAVRRSSGTRLSDDSQVEITSPSTGQLLRYNSNRWENWSPNFLTAEADTLQTVTSRGSSTTTGATFGGNVGIGTTNPSAGYGGTISNVKLALRNGTVGAQNGTSVLLIGGDNNHYSSITAEHIGVGLTYLAFGTSSSATNPSEKMRITSAGNVGIGTTSPASKLQIQGTGTGAWLTINRTDSGTNIVDFTENSTRLGYVGYIASDLVLNNATASNTIFSTSNTERMRITSTGDVGIGTSSPSGKLHVLNSAVGGTYYGQLIVEQNGDAAINLKGLYYSSIYFGDAANPVESGIVYDHSTNTLQFRRSGNFTALGISPTGAAIFNGNVGIGTDTPIAKLAVEGAAYFADDIFLRDGATASGDILVRIYDSSDDGIIDVYRNNAVVNRIHGNGNSFITAGLFGIGTTSPEYMLDVLGSTIVGNATSVRLRRSTAGTNDENAILWQSSTLTTASISDLVESASAGSLVFKTATSATLSEKMRITSAGNVGVGTINPSGKLHVAGGDSYFSDGKVYINSTSSFGDQFSATGRQLNVLGLVLVKDLASTADPGLFAENSDQSGLIGFQVRRPSLGSHAFFWSKQHLQFDLWGGSTGVLRAYIGNNQTGNVAIGYGNILNTATLSVYTLLGAGVTRLFVQEGPSQSTNEVFGVYAGDGTTGRLVVKNGNVGIGTISPTTKLTVVDGGIEIRDGSSTGLLYKRGTTFDFSIENAGGNLNFFNYGGDERLMILVRSSNRVSIGNNQTPSARLEVQGQGNTSATSALNITNISNTSLFRVRDDAAAIFSGLAGTGTRMVVADANGLLSTQAVGGGTVTGTGTTNYISKFTSGSAIGDSQIFDNGTNVGIGTTSPGQKLEIAEAAEQGTTPPTIRITNTTTTYGSTATIGVSHGTIEFYQEETSGNYPAVSAAIMSINESSFAVAHGLGFFTNNNALTPSEQMRITSNGNVLIGTTADNGAKLQVGNGTSNSPSSVAVLSADGGNAVLNALSLVNSRTAANGNGTSINFHNANNYGATGRIANVLDSGTNASLRFSVYNSTDDALVERITLLSSGNVGIGTTAPLAENLLQVSRSVNGQNIVSVENANTGTGAYAEFQARNTNVSNSSSLRVMSMGTGWTTVGGFVQNSGVLNADVNLAGGLSIMTRAAADIRFYTNGHTNERMRITSTGNVGIGTSSPSQRLDVSGAGGKIAITNTGTTGYSELMFYEESTIKAEIWVNGSTQTDYAGANSMNIWQGSNAPMAFYTNGTNERLRITSGGHVNIGGNYTQTSDIFQVTGSSRFNTGTNKNILIKDATHTTLTSLTSALTFSRTDGISDLAAIFGWNNGGVALAGREGIAFATGGSSLYDSTIEQMRITSTGNVGIGTTSPSARLVVNGGGFAVQGDSTAPSSGYGLEIWNSATTSYIGSYNRTTSAYRDAFLFASNTIFENGGAERMRITSAGDVGIGTTSPTSKFQVNNNAGTGSAFYVDAGNPTGTTTLFEHTGANTPVAFAITKSGFSGSSVDFGILYIDMAHNVVGGGSNMHFTLRNSSGNRDEYGGLGASIVTNTAGATAGRLNFYTTNAGTTRNIRMVVNPDGNVGIGTTSPQRILELSQGEPSLRFNPTTVSAPYLLSAADGKFYFTPEATYVPTMTLSSGNVGIGTTSPNSKLSVNGGDFEFNRGTGALGNNYFIINKGASNDGGFILRRDNANDWQITNLGGSGNLTFYSYGNSSEVLTILRSNGNVGIGTTTPNAKLEVNGSAKIDTWEIDSFAVNNAWLAENVYFDGTNFRYRANGYAMLLYSDAGSGFQLRMSTGTGGAGDVISTATNLSIKPNGNVQIGTTTDAGYKLDVNGVARGTAFHAVNDRSQIARGFLRLTSATNNTSTLDISVEDTVTSIYSNYYGGGADQPIRIGTYANLTNQLYLATSGYVGIGVTGPSERLHVSGRARITTIDNGTGDFATISGTGVITRRTAAQVLSDIGASASSGSNNYIQNQSAAVQGAAFRINGTGSVENMAIGGAGSFGGSAKSLFIAQTTTAPNSNPTGGVVTYVEDGIMKARSANGNITFLTI